MIDGARRLLEEAAPPLRGSVVFQEASVLELPYPDNHFDVVSSSRCLMALLEWQRQQGALLEIHRVLKPGGVLVLMEGTIEGLERLNAWRAVRPGGDRRRRPRPAVHAEVPRGRAAGLLRPLL